MEPKHEQKPATKKTTTPVAATTKRDAPTLPRVPSKLPLSEQEVLRTTTWGSGGAKEPSLLDLIMRSIANGETPQPLQFCDGVLTSLADELDALHLAATNTMTPMDDETVNVMIWRLAMRARAARDIACRMNDAQRSA